MFCHPCSAVPVLQWVQTVDTRQPSVCQPCVATACTQPDTVPMLGQRNSQTYTPRGSRGRESRRGLRK